MSKFLGIYKESTGEGASLVAVFQQGVNKIFVLQHESLHQGLINLKAQNAKPEIVAETEKAVDALACAEKELKANITTMNSYKFYGYVFPAARKNMSRWRGGSITLRPR